LCEEDRLSKKNRTSKSKSKQRPNAPRRPASAGRPEQQRRLLTALAVGLAFVVVMVGGFAWHQQPSFCSTMCHSTMAPFYDSYRNPAMLAGAHAKAGVVCLDCHKPTGKEQLDELRMQLTGTYPKPLPEIEFGASFCAAGSRCHGEANLGLAAKKTASMQPNPHDSANAQDAVCTRCHNMHRR
jgi:hypothetical protein